MKKVLFVALVIILGVGTASLSSVAHGVTIIATTLPGTYSNVTSTPGSFISNFYQFSLMIGGVLALGVITYGGVRYMTSSGNPSGQSEAKEWIYAALLGLLLLVGAYFILEVVNPQLLQLNLPTLQDASQKPAPSAAPTPTK